MQWPTQGMAYLRAMDAEAGIVDQWVAAAVDEIRDRAAEELRITDGQLLTSLAFLYLCVRAVLDLPPDDAFDIITDGSNDRDLDAVHIGPVHDGEFRVTVFQSKYSRALDGTSTFPENAIKGVIDAVGNVFDPNVDLGSLNPRVATAIATIRSLIRDGNVPTVIVIVCNNGQKWGGQAEQRIAAAPFREQVSWRHFNHKDLFTLRRRSATVDATLRLSGDAVVESMDYTRILIGRIPAAGLANLVAEHGNRLLDRNIRRFLGLSDNRVNSAIARTLKENPENLYFFNNGITMTCTKFSHNALQRSDFSVQIKDLHIVNGGQTSMTIASTWHNMTPAEQDRSAQAHVMVRLYEIPSERDDLASGITEATNSQNPVDMRDLRANDDQQVRLELGVKELGYTYVRKRSDRPAGQKDLTSATVATAILSVWRKLPHKAKFYAKDVFGSMYQDIFAEDLNATQAVIAALALRKAETRRRSTRDNDPLHVRYSSYFVAMIMGQRLLDQLDVTLERLDHTRFDDASNLLHNNGEVLLEAAINDIDHALVSLYGDRDLSLQQLAATFRRGDLFDHLTPVVSPAGV